MHFCSQNKHDDKAEPVEKQGRKAMGHYDSQCPE